MSKPWKLSVATYNILADAYIRPEYFPRSAPEDFLTATRRPRLIERIAGFGTDVICLQEVEYGAYVAIEAHLRTFGYRGRWAHRPNGKPDGCATFLRMPWSLFASFVLEFRETGPKPCNRIALMSMVGFDGLPKAVIVNAHLEWSPPDAMVPNRVGARQAEELAEFLASDDAPSVVCGDLNDDPSSDVLGVFHGAGYDDAHPPSAATCNASGSARKIDHILSSRELFLPKPPPLPPTIGGDTPLPSRDEPSDHLPLIATFESMVG